MITEPDICFGALTDYVHSDLSLYTLVGVALDILNPIRIYHVTLGLMILQAVMSENNRRGSNYENGSKHFVNSSPKNKS